jgi:hypothetical protein
MGRPRPRPVRHMKTELLALTLVLLVSGGEARAQEPTSGAQAAAELEASEAPADPPTRGGEDQADGEYHTPLAGDGFSTELFGLQIDLEDRYRGDTFAVTLGATGFTPNIGGNTFIPFFALYYNRVWEERRVRAILSGVVNNPVDYAEHFLDGHLDLLAHFDSSTIPVTSAEIVDGDRVDFSELFWGWAALELGAGFRHRVWPWNIDNDLRVQVLYRGGYHYFKATHNTGLVNGIPVANIQEPPDTWVHGLRVKLRLDMIQRNILELPHYGVAVGGDLEVMRRDTWVDTGLVEADGRRQFSREDTRDFTKLSGYLVLATGIPLLSERHRLVFQLHGAWAPLNDLDRYSGFRLGGGPQPTESNDLSRSPYPGAMFDQFIARWYAIGSLEYRLEVLFFLYLHARATLAYADVPTFQGTPPGTVGPVRFVEGRGEAYSAGFTTGFLWNSLLRAEYTYDSGAIRAGDHGHTILVMWSKSF